LIFAFITVFLALQISGSYLTEHFNGQLSLQQRYVDGNSYISHVINNTKYKTGPNIILLGASVTRESVPNDTLMTHRLRAIYGKSALFQNLGSKNQAYDESLALLNSLYAPAGSLIIQQIALRKLDKNSNFYNNQFLNPRFDGINYDVLLAHNPVINRIKHHLTPKLILMRYPLLHFLEKRRCSLKMILYTELYKSCSRPVAIQRSIYNNKTQLNLEEKKQYILDVENRRYKPAVTNHQLGFTYITAMHQVAKEKSYKLILIDYPVSPLAKATESKYDKLISYSQKIEVLNKNTHYYDFRMHPDFREKDFQDTYHLIDSGKNKMAELMINKIKEILL